MHREQFQQIKELKKIEANLRDEVAKHVQNTAELKKELKEEIQNLMEKYEDQSRELHAIKRENGEKESKIFK